MRKVNFLLILLLLGVLGGTANGATVVVGTDIKPSGGAGQYTLTQWNATFTTWATNSSRANFTGLTAGTDVLASTTGLICEDVTTCEIPSTASAELIYIYDFYTPPSSLAVVNMSGNLTNLSICYTTTAQANLTLLMEDLDGDCNYGITAQTGSTSDVAKIRFTRSITSVTECSNILETNATAGTYCIIVAEDESVSEANLASIILGAVVMITTIIYALQWDSKTTT